MTPPPPNERPTAAQLRDGKKEPVTIAGKPADICPKCGCALFVNGTNATSQKIFRYVVCRNPMCGATFESEQPLAKLTREVPKHKDNNFPSSGEDALTIYRESA